jgi:hypothetical protein
MPDFRIIGKLVEALPALPTDDWMHLWNARNQSVRAILGETVEPGMVCSFSWKDYILPGACALTYKLNDGSFLYMTLGLTQPLHSTDTAYPWEFAVRAKEQADWPLDLLYQLLSQWLGENGEMGFGYHLPLKFFIGHDGKTWPSISETVQHRHVVGTSRGLYLWKDYSGLRFKVSSGDFRLLTVVAVTEDEDNLADEATPAHVILLLRRMGIGQILDPYRRSVLSQPGALDEWARIKRLSHDDALAEIDRA